MHIQHWRSNCYFGASCRGCHVSIILFPSRKTIGLLWVYGIGLSISLAPITKVLFLPLASHFYLTVSHTVNLYGLIQTMPAPLLTCSSCWSCSLWVNILFLHLLSAFVPAADPGQNILLVFQKRTAAPQITLKPLASGISQPQSSVCI